jgi:dynein heavy chain
LFSLAFFHAIILERKKFGPIGWNTAYKWMNSDFQTCNLQLKIYLEEQEEVPYSCLNYIFAEVNYGGRVTDSKDTRLIIALLSRYFNPDVIETKHYKFSESDLYKSPEDLSLSAVKDYINDLPLKDQPEIFGLH